MRLPMILAVLATAALSGCLTDDGYRRGDIPPGAPGGMTGDRQLLDPNPERACRFYGPPRSEAYDKCISERAGKPPPRRW